MVSNIYREGSRLGLHINAAETETQCFLKQKQVISLSIGNVALQQVESFIYLEGKLKSNNNSSEDIVRRIGLAMGLARSLTTHNMEGIQYHDRHETIAIYRSSSQYCCTMPKRGASRRNTKASCVYSISLFYAEFMASR